MAYNTRGGRLFDLVVWGSAGFTGRLIVEYICRAVVREHPKLRWAIAARDRAKAEAVKAWAMERAGALPPGAQEPAVLIGDARDQASVDRIVGETRVVLAAAGPFWSHGAPVVDACVRLGAGDGASFASPPVARAPIAPRLTHCCSHSLPPLHTAPTSGARPVAPAHVPPHRSLAVRLRRHRRRDSMAAASRRPISCRGGRGWRAARASVRL